MQNARSLFMKNFFLLLICVFSLNVVVGQIGFKRGIQAYEREQFYACIKVMEPLADNEKTAQNIRAEAAYYTGMSYLRLSNPAIAMGYFRQVISMGADIPEAYLYLGESLQMMEHFDEAEKNIKKYLSIQPNDSIGTLKLKSLEYCKHMMKNPTPYIVRIMPSFNTAEMDYSPFFDGKDFSTVYFTSSRFYENKTKTNKESGEPYSNIFYTSESKDGFWSFPQQIPGSVNSRYDEGTASLNRQSKNLYFTRCTYNRNKDKACRIYMAKKSTNVWYQVEQLEITGIPAHISIGHPCISHDELTLYFVADSLLGGYGGKDIYKLTRTRKSDLFGAPQNLGPDINTRGDESYPYIRNDKTLYFASNGHTGMGGYDIFRATQKGPASYTIENMGSPLNSPHDDFGIVFMDDNEEGYFTSERKGGMGKADIYYFVLPKLEFDVSGIVWDKQTNSPVKGAKLSLLNTDNELISSLETTENGRYRFVLDNTSDYTIYLYHVDYKLDQAKIETINLQESKHFIKDFFLVK